MGVIVRLVDPAAAHLKRRAEQLGRKVVKKGGGVLTEVMDGYIVRAQGDERRAVVAVIGMPWSFCSPIPNLYTFGSATQLIREVRIDQPLGRFTLDRITDNPSTLPLESVNFRPFQAGVALVAGSALASVTAGAWSTADPVVQPGVILCPAVRSATAGGQRLLDTLIYRATAGRRTLKSEAGANQIEFRAAGLGAVTSEGELAYVVLSAATMGFSPGTPSDSALIMAPCATELSAGEGVAAVRSVVPLTPETVAATAHVVRYSVDFATSAVSVLWRHDLADATPVSVYAAGGAIKALIQSDDALRLLSFDPAGGFAGSVTLAGGDVWVASNPLAYTVDDQPWFFCPRRKAPDDVAESLRYRTRAEDVDAVLVSPDGAVVPVATPGYYVHRATNRVERSGSDDDGTAAGDRVARYGFKAFAEFGVGYACVYAPGILAVVVCPEADFALPTQRRYLALVSATTGVLIQVSAEPICDQDVWYGVSLSCYEQGTVDDEGALTQHGRLLVSVWRPYVAALDVAPPDPATLGVWVTADAGETLVPLYQLATNSAMAPVQRATYLGSPLLPAAIGETRRQWTS